jgi:Antibiotic biosynthesis monooxygenase
VFAAVWEYEVAPGQATAFEEAYGRDGAWAALFRRSPAYRGTLLVADRDRAGRYVVVDRFADEASYRAALVEHRDDYDALSARCEPLWLRETPLAGPGAEPTGGPP